MISWIIGSTNKDLDDRENGFYLLGQDGFGVPAFHRIEERGPLQHGVTDRGYRLDARTINLILGIKGSDLTDFWYKRSEIIELFKPINTAGKLRWEYGGVVRQIDGYLIGGLEFSDSERDYLFQSSAVSIKCPDPTWYDPSLRIVVFSLGGGSDTMEIPLAIPLTVGASSINVSSQIVTNGTVRSYPIVNIAGPITDCKITNQISGDKLDFTGYTIPAGTTITIDLRYGYKTVTDHLGNNQIDKLTKDSDLVSFCIETAPIAPGGSNSVVVSGTGITEATEIKVTFYDRYMGI